MQSSAVRPRDSDISQVPISGIGPFAVMTERGGAGDGFETNFVGIRLMEQPVSTTQGTIESHSNVKSSVAEVIAWKKHTGVSVSSEAKACVIPSSVVLSRETGTSGSLATTSFPERRW